MVTTTLTIQDLIPGSNRSGKKVDVDAILPYLILPGLLLIATISRPVTIIVMVVIGMGALYVHSRPRQKNRSSFFFSWTMSSGICMFLVFESGVLGFFEITQLENFVFLLLLCCTCYFFYKMKAVADFELATGTSKGKEYSPVLTADSHYCQICQIEVNERFFHSIWWDCCVLRPNYIYFLAGQIFAFATLLFGTNLGLTTVCQPYIFFGVILMPQDCDDMYYDFNSTICFVTCVYALGYLLVITLVLIRQLLIYIPKYSVLEDRFAEDDLVGRQKRSTDSIYFDEQNDDERTWNDGHIIHGNPIDTPSVAAINPNDEIGRFFIQYNNVPMGAERVGNRLFVTIPRRRFGIPATLNYIDLSVYGNTRSPPLTPYPDMARSRSLISVYRTRADQCGRLWTVDTGTIEIPNNPRYIRTPAIVVYDLRTDREILRYELKSSDLPANNTPTGLASITVDIKNGDCTDAYAFIADVVTYGVIVFSLKQRDSWRQQHNYFHFNPTAGNLRVAGQSFTWNDGVFSIALGNEGPDGCRTAFFHPMVSSQEFAVSACELESREANQTAFNVLGDRGANSQSTMHDIHTPSNVIFFAEIAQNAVSCWNTEKPLNRQNMQILGQDGQRLSYPSDLHVTNDEVWVTANTLPRFIYSRLDTDQYNFFVYRANVNDLISGTTCEGRTRPTQGYMPSSHYGSSHY